jgi:hypothetical protein
MRNRILSSIAAAATATAAPVSGQTPASMSSDLQPALDVALAAIRRGDEALGGEALERELVDAA